MSDLSPQNKDHQPGTKSLDRTNPVTAPVVSAFVLGQSLQSLLYFWSDCGADTAFVEDIDKGFLKIKPQTPATFKNLNASAKETKTNKARNIQSDRPSVDSSKSLTPQQALPPKGPKPSLQREGPKTYQTPGLPPSSFDGDPITLATNLASEAKTIKELSEKIADYQGCALSHMGARQMVFARGSETARIVLIGEAPGADEDKKGQPFVGRAGQLLDKMLHAAGLEKSVFITNTVFWRPPANRTPHPEEQATCAPFLQKAISLINPDYLLLLGGSATRAILHRPEGILSLRGRWFEVLGQDGRSRPTLASLHPAFLLRQPAFKKQAWQDFLEISQKIV